MIRKLNLGCGINPKQGYENHDIIKWDWADLCFDLEKIPYPAKPDTYDEIFSHHVFEHVKNFVPMVLECHRILKDGGVLIIEVPYVKNTGAIANPLHYNYFDENTFESFYNKENIWGIDSKRNRPYFKLEKMEMKFGKFPVLQWLLYRMQIFWCGGEIKYTLRKIR